MPKVYGKTAAERATESLIKCQQIANTALRLNSNSRHDAIAWLDRDYERQLNDWADVPLGDDKPKETMAMKIVREASEYLQSHPSWDGTVQYELLNGGTK